MIKIDYKNADTLSGSLDNLYYIITLLRSPEGCPFDRIQTNKSATESLIDEAYEYMDGVVNENIESMREEIGDVLINVFMNLYIHEEAGDFKSYEAVNEVCEKLIRRHQHVFSDVKAKDAANAVDLWNTYKEKVEGHKDKSSDFFSHIPSTLPPLETSYEIIKKLQKISLEVFTADELESIISKTLVRVLNEENPEVREFELGRLLYSTVALCKLFKVRPNTALFTYNQNRKTEYQEAFNKANSDDISICAENSDTIKELLETR